MRRRGQRQWSFWAAVLVLSVPLCAGAVRADDARPRLRLEPGGRLVASSLPAILGDEDVERHLDSGLTTSFVLEARPYGAARVDVRYELWDEVYLVTRIDASGEVETSRQESAADLADWWAAAELVVSATSVPPGAGDEARVSLAVVPFSQAELVDTQKWLTESIGQAQGGGSAGRSGGASRAVGALIATSLQRRSVRSTSWTVPIERRGGP